MRVIYIISIKSIVEVKSNYKGWYKIHINMTFISAFSFLDMKLY